MRPGWLRCSSTVALWLGGAAGALGCSSPDMDGVLFGCETNADCLAGRVCGDRDGVRACMPAELGPLTIGMTGPFRVGWSMDYPSPQNFLEPLYSTGAGANFTSYSNPEFDALLAKGNAAAGGDEAIAFYNQAEDVLLEDLPVIPLFFDVTQSVHSTAVGDVVVDAFGRVDTTSLTATD